MGIGYKLKTILKERNLTIKEFAQKIDVPPTTLYSFIKRDSQSANSQLLQKIVTALNIPLSELLNVKEYTITEDLLTEHPELKDKLIKTVLQELDDYNEPCFEELLTSDSLSTVANILRTLITKIELNDTFELVGIYLAISSRKETLLKAFNKLNWLGKDEAIKRVNELTELSRYTEKYNILELFEKKVKEDKHFAELLLANNRTPEEQLLFEQKMEDIRPWD